jgi:hypothetical protein
MRSLHKRADLSLSINAIVVLILAITMLGLGLAFLRGTFKKTEEQFSEVAGTVKEQVIEEIKSRAEKLYIRGEPELEVRRGETKEVFYGVMNVLDTEETFNIYTTCTESVSGIPQDDIQVELTTLPSRRISANDIAILPLRIKVGPDAELDIYGCEMAVTVVKETVNTVSEDPSSKVKVFTFGSNEQEYISKRFFIKVI